MNDSDITVQWRKIAQDRQKTITKLLSRRDGVRPFFPQSAAPIQQTAVEKPSSFFSPLKIGFTLGGVAAGWYWWRKARDN